MTGKIAQNKIQKNFRLSAECVKKLEDYAELTGEDMTAILERAIEKHLDSVALDVAEDYDRKSKAIRKHVSDETITKAGGRSGPNSVCEPSVKRAAISYGVGVKREKELPPIKKAGDSNG